MRATPAADPPNQETRPEPRAAAGTPPDPRPADDSDPPLSRRHDYFDTRPRVRPPVPEKGLPA